MSSDLFDKLAAEEASFLDSQFLAPVLRGHPVRVCIAGIVLHLEVIRPKRFQGGWGIYAPLSYKECRFVRQPTLTERMEYLKLFPKLCFILCRREGGQWLGIPSYSDNRFRISGLVPIHLVEEGQLFESVITRFDGANCWFERNNARYHPQMAGYLREQLSKLTEPKDLILPQLTPEARDAYLLAYGPAIAADIESKKDKEEERIKEALQRAGATYRSYLDRGDAYTIEFLVGNETHRSTVRKDNLAVESAGICLSGNDKLFDLQSLVGVVRTGQQRHRIVRVGDNQRIGTEGHNEEEDYY